MRRAALFATVGVAFFAYWTLADPSYDETASLTDTKYVLLFSAAILTLASALPSFAQLAGGRTVYRLSPAAAAAAALSSLANLVEDGLGVGWAFWAFVLGAAILDVCLLALTVAIALTCRGRHRLLALVPAATLASVVFYVAVGGPLMLATWLAAAAVALATSPRIAPAGTLATQREAT